MSRGLKEEIGKAAPVCVSELPVAIVPAELTRALF